MTNKQRELLLHVVDKDQTKQSDQEKLHKTYDDNIAETPVTDMNAAMDYYAHKIGFNIDWGGGRRRD